VSGGEWTLEPNAEREILLRWRERQTDHEVEARVLQYLAGLLRQPFRPTLEDGNTGVYSLDVVPGTDIGLGSTLNPDTREVVLYHVG
jgi:hypothetical protein